MYKVIYRGYRAFVNGMQKQVPEFVVEHENWEDCTAYERCVFDIMEMFGENVWHTRHTTFMRGEK